MAQAPQGLDPTLNRLYKQAKKTKLLHISGRRLQKIPPQIFELEDLERLDLSVNEIEEIPKEIGRLKHLKELWLNDNPLKTISGEIGQCKALRMIDFRDTDLSDLPTEISILPKLVFLDLSGSALTGKLRNAFELRGGKGAVQHLKEKHKRRKVKGELKHTLLTQVYSETGDTAHGKHAIVKLVKSVCHVFKDTGELQTVVRNAERLFPEKAEDATAEYVRERFNQLDESNRKKQLSAEIELKVRAIYYGKIDPPEAEHIVKSVLETIPTLKDMRFLLAHAPSLFPEEPNDANGKDIYQNLIELRSKLRQQKEEAMSALKTSLDEIYFEQDPEKVKEQVRALGKELKSIEDIKAFAADASDYCPSEFKDFRVHKVVQAFQKEQEETKTAT